MYEARSKSPISTRQFQARIARHVLWILFVVAVALSIGIVGYHFLGNLSWMDSLLNASMILGGMGPVDELHSDGAKLFASFYALFAGLVFIGVAGLLTAPFAHRLLHRFHWEGEES